MATDPCPRCLTEHVPPWRGCDPADLYRNEMGKDPPPPDPAHPLAWQWAYRGTKQERERLGLELSRREAA